MLLSTLLQGITPISPEVDREVARLILDSRQVTVNDLFLAVPGSHVDGRLYVADAIAKGAAAVLVETEDAHLPFAWQEQVPVIPIQHLQQKLGVIAARAMGEPAKKLRMIGVTGTNGKTSCTHFMAEALQAEGISCGIIGTLGSGLYGHLGEAALTTPDALTLQATLQNLLAQHAKAVAIEVSSHSIHQGRINGIDFEIGVFTNLTQDHLDYHGDMATYAAVKRRFLAEFPTKHVVINVDDVYGRQWAMELAANKTVYGYSTAKTESTDYPLIYASDITLSLHGIKARVHSPWGEGDVVLPLIGQFNLSNGLAVLTALCVYGLPFATVLQRLSHLHPVPGRMQTVGGDGMPLVVVDYAHTPDALEKVLQALRLHIQGELGCVFGCGGERDTGKRPLMAKVAEQLAQRVIVTNDNPRHENPAAIAEAILRGFTDKKRVQVILDRSKAIENSIQCARATDCVLIAGKGAEHYQQIGDEKIPFDDVEQVKKALREDERWRR